jgi:hypothetical protein
MREAECPQTTGVRFVRSDRFIAVANTPIRSESRRQMPDIWVTANSKLESTLQRRCPRFGDGRYVVLAQLSQLIRLGEGVNPD